MSTSVEHFFQFPFGILLKAPARTRSIVVALIDSACVNRPNPSCSTVAAVGDGRERISPCGNHQLLDLQSSQIRILEYPSDLKEICSWIGICSCGIESRENHRPCIQSHLKNPSAKAFLIIASRSGIFCTSEGRREETLQKIREK